MIPLAVIERETRPRLCFALDPMPSDASPVVEWKRRAQQYERIIGVFEKIANDMKARRKGATDSVMVMLDERLKLNERTLRSLRLGLKSAQKEVARLESKS